MRRTPRSGPFEPGYAIMRGILVPWLRTYFKFHIEGTEHIPASGPAIIAANHISYFDPFAVGFAVHRNGRRPRFLGKSELFKYPVIGWVLRTGGQIRVDRGTRAAPQSLQHAEDALAQGEVLVVFPEGTTTTAPDLAPLKPKSGVARLALRSGIPVIPCATWGGQWFWTKHLGIKPAPGKDIWVRFGAPISFKEYQGREEDSATWNEIAGKVMDEIGIQLVGLKAAKPWAPQEPTKKRFIRKGKKGTEFERRS
jgi:1-acyl-sn-glycerol-3-phosphate acyltransferase